ncbi:putative Mn2+ efflux pump MntP [Natronobacillus azotifigens]|uniref:Putative manganese efflux pump MntP n=1 Tax=Natronobacillus azotifigens TaxID=472978 RepID=A0A9J6REQ6_9BACI|nr:manganese efflux pump MntP family protein [Natronobacillus azotifigens]MCZ0703657.1 manganese efflux pump MntP family protein [Natronobacillus azotifigens]
MPYNQADPILGIIIIALALGMDAFSVGLGIGMQMLRLKRIFLIGLIVGLFHILMPLIGVILGTILSTKIENFTDLASGLLLFGLGIHMILQTLEEEPETRQRPFGWSLVFFAFTVSLDSFPVGLSFGITGIATWFTFILFGFTSMILTWIGLLIGKKARHWVGVYSEWFGGIILCIIGMEIIFH